VEHAILHLLYARFWTRALRRIGRLDVAEHRGVCSRTGMVTHGDLSLARTAAGSRAGRSRCWGRWPDRRLDRPARAETAHRRRCNSKRNVVDILTSLSPILEPTQRAGPAVRQPARARPGVARSCLTRRGVGALRAAGSRLATAAPATEGAARRPRDGR
jgi:hypothetical protein